MVAESNWLSTSKRKTKKEILTESTVYQYQYRCRAEIKKHHEEMKNDPERLTTSFLIDITNCECKQRKNEP